MKIFCGKTYNFLARVGFPMRFIVFHFHDRLPEFALVGLVGVHCRVKCIRVKTHKGHLVVVLDVRLVEIDHPGG
jgi:hypothetical protein